MRGLLVALVLVVGCGLPADVVKEVEAGRDGALAVAQDGRLDDLARRAGLACYDYSWAVLYSTGEADELPDDVRQRREARARGERVSLSTVPPRAQ